MTTAVVDASVVAQWLIPESTTPLALRLLEIGNVIWKRIQLGEIAVQDGEGLIAELLRLPLKAHLGTELLQQAFTSATAIGVTVYDGLYLALAMRLGAPLITADGRLISRVQALGQAVQVIAIADLGQWL